MMHSFSQFKFHIQVACDKIIKMAQEIFSLNWKTFDIHLATTLRDLITENIFTDVTLVSDDQTQF